MFVYESCIIGLQKYLKVYVSLLTNIAKYGILYSG